MNETWDELKRRGSDHYKTGSTECIDLYRSGHMFQEFALASIIKYAFRSREEEDLDRATFERNMDKIIHLASLLKADNAEIKPINMRTLDGE